MKYKLDRSAHSVYSLHQHLVVVIKCRRKALFAEAIRERLKQIIWSLADELGIEILAQEPAEDHHHILFTATPTTNLSNVVNYSPMNWRACVSPALEVCSSAKSRATMGILTDTRAAMFVAAIASAGPEKPQQTQLK